MSVPVKVPIPVPVLTTIVEKYDHEDPRYEVIKLNNGSLCISNKGFCSIGTKGTYLPNGTLINLGKDVDGIFNFLKCNKKYYKIKTFKKFEGIFINSILNQNDPLFSRNNSSKKSIKKFKFLKQWKIPELKEYKDTINSKISSHFIRKDTILLKNMPNATYLMIVNLKTEDGNVIKEVFTKHSSASTHYLKYIDKYEWFNMFDHDDNQVVHGYLFDGKFYITNVYDMDTRLFLTRDEVDEYCDKRKDIKALFKGYEYDRYLINSGSETSYYINRKILNDEGLLKIKKTKTRKPSYLRFLFKDILPNVAVGYLIGYTFIHYVNNSFLCN